MDYFKLFNILGISLQIMGVLILENRTLWHTKIDAASESIPSNPLSDAYKDIKEGEQRVVFHRKSRTTLPQRKRPMRTKRYAFLKHHYCLLFLA
ncbi:MAG: hypothetical protein LBU11_05215 [Zoogloeaceae bacterium]|jgi:hypothetical protein|nr:hypothetical protein [Zoogloeaceae bacterium]